MTPNAPGSTLDPDQEVAGSGTVFVCGACGRRSMDRAGKRKINGHWDESCRRYAVLCYKSSLRYDCNGLVVGATAVGRN